MSDKSNQPAIVVEKISSGEFFTDARKWYDSTYNAPMGERPYLIVISVIAAFIIYYSFSALSSILPIVSHQNIIIKQKDTLTKLITIQTLADSYQETDAALMKLHLEDYVYAREEYVTDNLDKNFHRVMALSTRKVFDTYQSFMDPRNTASPITLYERHTTRVINIVALTIISSNGAKPEDPNYKPDKAIVAFEATVSGGQGGPKVEKWDAELAFNYKGIVVDQQTLNITPMEFLVTDYKSTRKFGE